MRGPDSAGACVGWQLSRGRLKRGKTRAVISGPVGLTKCVRGCVKRLKRGIPPQSERALGFKGFHIYTRAVPNLTGSADVHDRHRQHMSASAADGPKNFATFKISPLAAYPLYPNHRDANQSVLSDSGCRTYAREACRVLLPAPAFKTAGCEELFCTSWRWIFSGPRPRYCVSHFGASTCPTGPHSRIWAALYMPKGLAKFKVKCLRVELVPVK